MNFDGIFTPAIVPLDANGQIDYASFAEVLEFLIAAKVHGIVVAGTTGEYYAHSKEERAQSAKKAKEVIAGRIPLVVGTGAIRTDDSIEYAKMAREIGADAILLGSPPYALPNVQENINHALAIDAAADLPIILYNYPGRAGVTMEREYFQAVTSKSKNFVAIKESTGSIANMHILACEFPELQLSCGWDDQALEFFAWGARSWVCAGSNFIPREHLALYEACVVQKDFTKGRKIMAALMPLMNFLDDEGVFVQTIKAGCDHIGLKAGGVRRPLQAISSDQRARLGAIIDKLKADVAAA